MTVIITFAACTKETVIVDLPENDLIIDAQFQSPEGIKHSNVINIRR